jgi:hypothetical protein
VSVESVRLETLKVGQGKRAKKETVVLIQFSGALNAGTAENPGAYQLAPLMAIKAGGRGKGKKVETKLGRPVPVASAVYNAANDTVTLIPRGQLNLTQPLQLQIDGVPPSGLQDSSGRYLDGAQNGQPGSNAGAVLSRHGATLDAVVGGSTAGGAVTSPAAVDALLQVGALDEFVGPIRARHRARLGPAGA